MEVRIEQKADYLEFIATGIHDATDAPERLTTILNSCKLAGVNKAMIGVFHLWNRLNRLRIFGV